LGALSKKIGGSPKNVSVKNVQNLSDFGQLQTSRITLSGVEGCRDAGDEAELPASELWTEAFEHRTTQST